MKKKSTLSFALSQEEIFVALGYLNQPTMAGLEMNVLDELSEREKMLILGVAERAMIARAFLIRSHNHRLQLSSPAFACLSACADPDKSIIIKYTLQNGPEEHYFFHTARKMRVIHTLPLTAIHQFIAVEDDLALNKAILSVLKIKDTPKAKCADVEFDISIFIEARNLALDGKIKETEAIFKKKIDGNSAALLADALSMPISNTTISFIDKVKNHMDGFSIFESKENTWLLKPSNSTENSNKIIIRLVDSKKVIAEIKNWF